MDKNKIIRQENAFNAGFTLAEVLITLGVIGVVAALTMPALINKTNNLQYKSAYKKAFSTLNNALVMAKADSEITTLSWTTSEGGTHYAYEIGDNFKALSNYMKTTKKCFNNNANQCWECNGQAGFLYGGSPEWTGCSTDNYAFIDTSGTGYYLYSNRENAIVIDVNGFKSPNKLGKDRYFVIFSSNSAYNKSWAVNFPSEVNGIIPHGDIVTKGRWCPDGNCLYYSDLYN